MIKVKVFLYVLEASLLYFLNLPPWELSLPSLAGRISSLEEEARQQRQILSKAESEKRQLQEKHTDMEKVNLINQSEDN